MVRENALPPQEAAQLSILNLSNKVLTPGHLSVLNKGLNFVPTNQSNDFNVKVDCFRFFRSIRLREFFSTCNANASDLTTNFGSAQELGPPKTPFRGKSFFVPPPNRNASIETFCRLVENDIEFAMENKHKCKTPHNLNKAETEALSDLQSDSSVIIRSADKGGALVILNKIDYVSECTRQLQDTNFYCPLPGDPTISFKTTISEILGRFSHSGEITDKEFDFLSVQHPRIPVFYTIPKVHKNPAHPPGRPIVSGIGSLTSNISTFVDFFIRPIAEELPSFVKDTGHLITLLESLAPLPADCILVTFDVEALYTNVPHDGGIQALEHFLQPRSANSIPSNHSIITLAELVLTHNYFMFQNDFYLQKKGVAMGSNMSCNFASLYVGYLEKTKILNSVVNPFFPNLLVYRRYVDDIFCLFKGSADLLHGFCNFLNSASEHLRFTVNFDLHKVSFLDTWIIRKDDMLYTDLYTKPTDRNSLLRADSCHPLPLKNSLPYSQLCRLKRICKDPNSFSEHSGIMIDKFRERGYTEKQLSTAVDRIEQRPRADLLIEAPKNNKKTTPLFITKYSRAAECMKPILNKHWHILKSDPQLHDVFPDPPRVVFSRGRNLRDVLVHSDLPPPVTISQRTLSPIPDGNYKCGACAQCNSTFKTTFFNHPHSGKVIPIKGIISCNTKGVIYVIYCPCGKYYVGKTMRALKTRIAEHRSSIRCKNLLYPVAAHFVEAGHSISSLRYLGVEKLPTPRRGGDFDNSLLKREAWWIHSLNTLAPNGLNIDFDLRPFL